MEFKSQKACVTEEEIGRFFHLPKGRTQISVYKLQKCKHEPGRPLS